MKTFDFDAVVVGSGIAGLSFALGLAARGRSVCLVTKKNKAESNTNYAQGGIACVTSATDDFESHVRDTLEAGDGLCNPEVVLDVVRDGPARIEEIARIGVEFSQLDDGRVSLGKEGGHSKRRILHVKDITGRAIEEALLHSVAANERIEVHEHCMAIDLITTRKLKKFGFQGSGTDNRVVGLYCYNEQTGEVFALRTPAVLLATGGVGQAYQFTTNPDIATGDGIAMAYRAGAEIQNLEFVQFHPTAFFSRDGNRFLISEAVRGEGAILRNSEGKSFMENYHPRRDLAPRDVVARAIDSEMKRSGSEHVYLDITTKSKEELEERFPTIYAHCREQGIRIESDWIPVVPAAHYLCGGVATSLSAETSIRGLYACGEVACTGLHGANRLASNSLLEALVLAHRAVDSVDGFLAAGPGVSPDLPPWVDGNVSDSDERVILFHNWSELRKTLWDYVGIVRTTKRLERARARIQLLSREINDYYWNFRVEPKLLELRNLVQVADLMVRCALQRKESRGLHYILDYPSLSPEARDTKIMD
ncbi:MAG: L-aspartate oxidase [Verrucomicrobiota bacterium]